MSGCDFAFKQSLNAQWYGIARRRPVDVRQTMREHFQIRMRTGDMCKNETIRITAYDVKLE